MPKTSKELQEKRKSLKAIKDPWEFQFQILGQYIYTRKQQFNQQFHAGAFLNDGMINDSTAIRSNSLMASAIMGAMWKSGGKTFKIARPDHIPDTDVNNKYYEDINKALSDAMEAPKANFEPTFLETLCEEGAFGTGSIGLFKGDFQNPLLFKSWSIQNIFISEGPDGFIDTVYYDESITIANLVERYGLEGMPETIKEKFKIPKSRNDRVTITIAIEPRPEKERADDDSALGMPIASFHFLTDETGEVLKESGFAEMPVRVLRWFKLANEVYGRGPGMDALPAIMQINALKESFLIGAEKKVDPPIYVLDDGSLGGGTVDTSARGLSVFNTAGRAPGQAPVGTIFDIGELQSVAAAIETTKEEILQHFLIDKLFDLNNKSRMTLGEAQIRNQIRSDSLSSIYARHTSEMIDPLVNRAFNILFSMGLLGVREGDQAILDILKVEGIEPITIPADVAKAIDENREIYITNYISPAAQIMREAEFQGLLATAENAIQLSAVSPEALDILNTDEVIRQTRSLTGGPSKIIRSQSAIDKIRASRAELQKKELEVRLAEAQSKAIKNVAGAAAQIQGAGGR